VLINDDEYFDVFNVKRPYSLEVGIFKDIVELKFRSSATLIYEKTEYIKTTE
jgi:hypothetical protein